MKRKSLQNLLALLFISFSFIAVLPVTVHAGNSTTCSDGTVIITPIGQPNEADRQCAGHNGVTRSQDTTSKDTFMTNPAGDCGTSGNDNCINKDIQLVVNFLSAGVGVVITIVIIIAGLQYMTSRDNPQAVQASKTRLINAVIALVAFVFIYAFLQWVVPGGVF